MEEPDRPATSSRPQTYSSNTHREITESLSRNHRRWIRVHWESQSTTSVASPTGQRYLQGTSTVFLFVRQEQKDEFGTAPYLFLGPATYSSHTGDRPIAITWHLSHELPSDFYNAASAVAL